MRCGRQIKSGAAGLQRKHKKRNVLIFLKLSNQALPLPHFRFSVQDQSGAAEDGTQKCGNRSRRFTKLRKHQNFFLSCGNCFECDNCYAACPEQAIVKLGKGRFYRVELDLCTGCATCFEQCPCHAIDMAPEPAAELVERDTTKRMPARFTVRA